MGRAKQEIRLRRILPPEKNCRLQTGDGGFVRREIPLDRPADKGWFIASGITAKDRVVVSGAQTILSEEVRGGGFRGGDRE